MMIMITMIKITVVIIINSPFQPGDLSTGSTTGVLPDKKTIVWDFPQLFLILFKILWFYEFVLCKSSSSGLLVLQYLTLK